MTGREIIAKKVGIWGIILLPAYLLLTVLFAIAMLLSFNVFVLVALVALLAACLVGLIIIPGRIVCPQCNTSVGRLLSFSGSPVFRGIPDKVKFCPLCGADFDADISKPKTICEQPTPTNPEPAAQLSQGRVTGVPFERKPAKNILKTLPIFVIIGIAGVVIVFLITSRDIPLPNTPDLILERTDLPPERNAYIYFISATNSFYWPTNSTLVNEYLCNKSIDEADISEIITRNAKTLHEIKRGLECQRCLAPEVTECDMPLPYLSYWLKIGKVMALKANHDRLIGRNNEATSTCIALLQFANMIQVDSECLVSYLVGIGVLHLGLEQAKNLARDQNTPQEELTRLKEALQKLDPPDHGFIHAIKGEYKVIANTIDQLRDGKLDWLNGIRLQGYVFQPNKTKLLFGDYYRIMIVNAPLWYADMKRFETNETPRLKAGKAEFFTRPNGVGRILLSLFLPGLNNAFKKIYRTECSIASTRLIIACNAYKKKEGKLPDDLQSLLPTYMVAIPADPYDGKSFRYSPSSSIVYSVGEDLKDFGGSTNLPPGYKEDGWSQKRWETEDIVFQINEKFEQTSGGDVLKAVPNK